MIYFEQGFTDENITKMDSVLNKIETPRSKAGEESDSVKDFFIVLFANPAAKLTGNALTGIHN